MSSTETSRVSSSFDNKDFSISEDERDLIDGTALIGNVRYVNGEYGNTMSKNQITETSKAKIGAVVSPSFISPTTAMVIRDNNRVLCPLGRKTGFLRRYCGAYAKFTFLSPNAEFEDGTVASYNTTQSASNDDSGRPKSICTCCNECKFCRRLSEASQKNFVDAAVQTETNTAVTSTRSTLGSEKSDGAVQTVVEKALSSKVVCTYLAEASDEFYPFSKAEPQSQLPASDDDTSPPKRPEMAPITSTPTVRVCSTPRRFRFKGKKSTVTTTSSDMFLNYIKLLILRRKEKFSEQFWRTYGAAFKPLPCMSSEEVEQCRRRFGDGYDTEQLERILPQGLKSSNGDWRREIFKISGSSKESGSTGHGSGTAPLTPTDRCVRTNRSRIAKKAIVSKDLRSASVRSTPFTSSSTSAFQNTSITPSRLRPVKMNRAAILRADAIFSKYLSTP